MPRTTKLAITTDTTVKLTGLSLASDGSYVNNATVTFTLKDADGVDVTGAIDEAMAFVAASDGDYQGRLDDTVSLTKGALYFIEITAVASGGVPVGTWREQVVARYQS